MSSPYDTIKAKYEASEHVEPWGFWLDWHLQNGFVFSTPVFFAMGRPVRSATGILWKSSKDIADTWYIWGLAGDMSKCWSILPYELPWIAFERIRGGKRELAFYRTEDLRRHTPRTENDASILAEA